MNKKFTKLMAALALLVFMTPSMAGWGQTSTAGFTLTAAGGSGTSGTITGIASETWSWSATFSGSAYHGYNNSAWQIGSGSNPCSQVVFSTSGIIGTISNIAVSCGTKNGVGKVNCTVGGSNFGTQEQSTGTGNNPTNYGTTPSFSGSATGEIVLTITNTQTYISVKSITVTYTTGSGTTTYTVTYNANGATSGTVPTDNTAYTSGATVTVLNNTGELAKEHYTCTKWNTKANGTGTDREFGSTFNITMNSTLYAKWEINTHAVTLPENDYGTYSLSYTYNNSTLTSPSAVPYGVEVTLNYTPNSTYVGYEASWSVNGNPLVGNKFNMPDQNVEITVSVALCQWVATDFANLTSADVFVIVCNKDNNNYALPNNNGNSSPSATAVSVSGNKLTGAIAESLQWNMCGDTIYMFYPKGSVTNYLYCTNSNDGVKVGTSNNANIGKHFKLAQNGYLTTNETNDQRYLGVYKAQDWRTYTSVTGNIANQTFTFYKKVTNDVNYSIQNIICHGETTADGGWYLIASPVASVTPSTENGFLTSDPDNYDLYRFNQGAELEWENWKTEGDHNHFNLESGHGYLYANGNSQGTTLSFTGQPYNGNGMVTLSYSISNPDENMRGWNLIGNPFAIPATLNLPYYRLNANGSALNTSTESTAVAAMEGVFVYAFDGTQAIETATFTPVQQQHANAQQGIMNINVMQNRGDVVDNAIVRFDEGRTLPKFYFGNPNANLYIPQGNKEYAIATSEAQGEMPLNFRANENGQYTLTVNPEGVEMNYLHLIDNMTGNDIDLLQTPSYSFNAKTTDYESRFRLVFAANNESGVSASSTTFAFYSNGNWMVNNEGEASLQVIDVMGRVLSNQTISGTAELSLNQQPGVYVLRLVNGNDVKTQKIVVR